MTHCGKYQHQLLLVMPHIGGFILHLDHQYDIASTIKVLQRADIPAELITEHEPEGRHTLLPNLNAVRRVLRHVSGQ